MRIFFLTLFISTCSHSFSQNEELTISAKEVYSVVDKMPEFKGGQSLLFVYLKI